MSKKMLFYVGLVMIIANMLYQEYWGLNTLIISIVFVIITAINRIYEPLENSSISWKWWFATLLFITNGLAVFLINTSLSNFVYFLSFLFYVGVHNEVKLSFPLGIVQSVQSSFSGLYHFFETLIERFQKKQTTKGSNKSFVRLLIYTVPLVIAIIFLKLYQNADPTFYEWTKFINLDWISWGFIIFYFLIFLACYGLFFFNVNKEISSLESNLENNISINYTDKVENYMGIGNEQKIALSLLITLNLMLLLYNIIDFRFIFIDLPNPEPTLRYSDLLHGGVNSLIASIVLVIFIITFIYRGQLNFQGSKLIRSLALIWLILNLLMVGTTVIKNYEYITHWGLTYKRIGVYVYLLLAASGLIFTFIKILRVKSIWFLIRNVSLTFFTCFTLIGLVNWDKLIVNYNLTQVESGHIDFYYLMSLGDETYPDLMYYYNDHKHEPEITNDPDLWHRLFEHFDSTRNYLRTKKQNTTWRSLNIREKELLERMNKFNLIYTPKYNRL